jgi:hypothetical protein
MITLVAAGLLVLIDLAWLFDLNHTSPLFYLKEKTNDGNRRFLFDTLSRVILTACPSVEAQWAFPLGGSHCYQAL